MWKKEKKQETQEVSPEKEEGRDLYEWAQALVCSVLAVVLLFTFVIRLIGVDGHSMVPTLQDGDRLLVLNAMLDNDYEYGDIVVLRKDTFLEEPIVKRVIATEGQTVDIDFVSGAVYVDGELLEEDYINEPTYAGGGDGISPDGAGGLHFRHGRQPKPLQRQPRAATLARWTPGMSSARRCSCRSPARTRPPGSGTSAASAPLRGSTEPRGQLPEKN